MVQKAVLIAAVCAACFIAQPSKACGPGLHVREADRTFERIQQVAEAWAALAEVPLSRSYMRFGSIAPDLQWAADLGFGHSVALSYYLLDRAADEDPRFVWFALGHLAHVTSDPACEMFLTPTVIASVPLGMVDFVVGYDDPNGESEGIVEGYGDLILGNWDGVVDLVYDFWADGEKAKDRAREVFLWYCKEGAAFSAIAVNCEEVLAALEALLSKADPILSGLSRDQAKDLVKGIITQPPEVLVDLFSSGLLSSFVGDKAQPTPWVHEEAKTLLATPLGDPTFWKNLYEMHFSELGPTWTIDRAINRLPADWPAWSGNAQVCGNIQSVMQFLPDEYSVTPGLIVDGVWWLDDQGWPVSGVYCEDDSKSFALRVRFYSALRFSGKIRIAIKKDLPGFDTSEDPVLAEKTFVVDEDPLLATRTQRTEVLVPFNVNVGGAIGFYAEVYVDEYGLPSFTTSWDRLWTIPNIDFFRPQYRNNFGTYGHWPASLQILDPQVEVGVLFVRVRSDWDQKPIENAWVQVLGQQLSSRTKRNGIAVFDRLESGPQEVLVGAPGHAVFGPITVTIEALAIHWLDVTLSRLPYQSGANFWPLLPEPPTYPIGQVGPSDEGQDETDVTPEATLPEPFDSDGISALDTTEFSGTKGGGGGGCNAGKGRNFFITIVVLLFSLVLVKRQRSGERLR